MRLPFLRGPRFTNPPEVVPLVIVGFMAVVVAHLAIGAFGALAVIAWTLLPGGESLPSHPGWLLAGAAGLALDVLLVVLGWRFVRRLVVAWFHRQPPEPLGSTT